MNIIKEIIESEYCCKRLENYCKEISSSISCFHFCPFCNKLLKKYIEIREKEKEYIMIPCKRNKKTGKITTG